MLKSEKYLKINIKQLFISLAWKLNNKDINKHALKGSEKNDVPK